nr:adenylate/guanylate cyclase domain-containing protein [Aquabacterium terrae]
MFCDIVGSTRLAGTLDPEDWRDLLHLFQRESASLLQPAGGHIAQVLGDGLLVYFGWPQAHEDDAERAVHVALALQPALQRAFPARLRAIHPGGLQVRIGIHTGIVVVGEVGIGDRRELLALGEAPNLAAHIQAFAAPGTVLVSDTTLRLLRGGFIAQDLGPHRLKDGAPPIRLAWVQGEHHPADRRPAEQVPLVGQDERLASLHQAWQAASAGAGRAVTLRGEPGLGKTRLAGTLRAAAQAAGAETIVLRCSAFHRQSPLYPLVELLARRTGLDAQASEDELVARLGAVIDEAGLAPAQALPLLAALIAPGSHAAQPTATLTPTELMRDTLAQLQPWLAGRTGPRLLLCEDVHWADPSTLRLLQQLVATVTHRPGLLLLLTQRTDFDPPWHVGRDTELIELPRLSPDEIRLLVQQLARAEQHALPGPLLERIVETADGVPLYAEEILRAVLQAPGTDQGWPEQVPATLTASLSARLDRLGTGKAVAQAAALLGREFSFETLAAVSELPVPALSLALHQLVSTGLLRRRGVAPQARYVFRHALLQAAAEESLLKSARRTLHLRIGDTLQAQFPGLRELEPETLARHFSEGGDAMRALPLWRHAGERTLARSAVIEALAHLDQGMALLDALDAGDARDRAELGLQVLRLAALRASQGVAAAATGAAAERAAGLARALHEDNALITALNGLYSFHMVRGECAAALAPAREMLRLADTLDDPTIEMISHRALGAVSFHIADPLNARAHLERALALYDPQRHAQLAHTQGIDHRVMAGNFMALTLLMLGEDDAARALQDELIAHAEAIAHAHSLGQALVFGCLLLSILGDGVGLAARAAHTARVGREHGFALIAGAGRFFEGAALLHGGDPAAALPAMREGAAAWWGTGARNYRAHGEMLMAQAELALGRLDDARALLRAAHEGIAQTGETWLEAELRRAEALMLREADGDAPCERRLMEALRLAQAQHALGWQRRCRQALQALQANGAASTSTP